MARIHLGGRTLHNLAMQVMNEQHEEDLHPTFRDNQQKIRLIDGSVTHFRRLVRASLVAALLRIGFFFVVFLNEDAFLCAHQDTRCDGWSIIFYILASLMDLLVVLNDAQILRFLKKESFALMAVKQQLAENRPNVGGTVLGPYSNYLSVSSVIKVYKFQARSMTSISQTIRYLEAIITFYVFGSLALDSQYKNAAPALQTAILWTFILSIYFTVFELDFLTLEASAGPYVETKTAQEAVQEESIEYAQVKDNYIRRIRRPFEVIYVITILLLLASTVFYFEPSLLSLMTGLCIAALMAELIFEKYMQNRLLGINLAAVPKLYLTPAQVRWELSSRSPKTHTLITTGTRLAIVLLLMAYFRSPSLQAPHSLLLFTANVLLFLGQAIKSEWVEKGRLYVLAGRRQDEAGGECAICLLGCEKGQTVLALPCFANHVFHAACLRNWLRQRRECPLCRYSLEHYELAH